MYIQGDLQIVFDALYHMGVIDPVLEMDWSEALDEMQRDQKKISAIVQVVNESQFDLNALMERLKRFDSQSLNYLAMEVAREFADFHTRENLH